MKRYEGLFILSSAAREEALKETIDKISAEIAAIGGKVETVQKMDKKPFSRVADRKNSSGYYVNILEAFGLVKRPTPAPTSTYAEAQAIISNIPVFGSVAGAAAGLLGPFLSWLP